MTTAQKQESHKQVGLIKMPGSEVPKRLADFRRLGATCTFQESNPHRNTTDGMGNVFSILAHFPLGDNADFNYNLYVPDSAILRYQQSMNETDRRREAITYILDVRPRDTPIEGWIISKMGNAPVPVEMMGELHLLTRISRIITSAYPKMRLLGLERSLEARTDLAIPTEDAIIRARTIANAIECLERELGDEAIEAHKQAASWAKEFRVLNRPDDKVANLDNEIVICLEAIDAILRTCDLVPKVAGNSRFRELLEALVIQTTPA